MKAIERKLNITSEEDKKRIYELFSNFHSVKEICEYFSVSKNTDNSKYIHFIANEVGFDFSLYKKEKETKYCLYCGKKIIDGDGRKKFCNSSCAAKYNNHRRKHSDETKQKISEKLRKINYTTEEKECILASDYTGKQYNLKNKLIKEGIKENKCECCGNDGTWMGKPLTLQLHHIDGNNKNNSLDNLMILCPNCHSQTHNFCGRNTRKKHEKMFCEKCGKELKYRNISGLCKDCLKEKQQEHIPPKEELEKEYENMISFNKLSRKYNVNEATIKKWFVKYNII